MEIDKRNRYEQLVYQFTPGMFRFAYRMLGDRHAAEDAVQETFSQAWRNFELLREENKTKAWLMSILRNQINQAFRKLYRRPDRTQLEFDDCQGCESTSDGSADKLEHQDWVQSAMERLDAGVREVVLLVMMEGHSTEQVGQELGLPRGTVLSRLHRGRRQLRQAFIRMEQEISG